MSEMGFYSLPTGKLHKKPKQSRLKNFPAGYVGSFYRNLADNVDNFLGSDCYGWITNDVNIPPFRRHPEVYTCDIRFRKGDEK